MPYIKHMTETKKLGRKPLPPDKRKSARIEWRTTGALKARAQSLASSAGLSLSQWIDGLVARAKVGKRAPFDGLFDRHVRAQVTTEEGSSMRKVMVSEYEKQGDGRFKLEEKGEAVFHQFGCNYEEFEGGVGNYTTAIIEWLDGTVGNVPVEHVRFLCER